MSTSALERHDLEQDIDELRRSIDSLESSRSRLRDLIPGDGAAQPGSVWSDLAEIVTDFFAAAGEALTEGDDDDDGDATPVAQAGKTAKKVITTDWSKALGEAFGRLRDRIAGGAEQGGSAPVTELGGVLGELDAEIARLASDLQQKLDRMAEFDRSIDDAGPITPVHPHHRDVPADDTTVVIPQDDDDDVIPVDVLPDVEPVVPVAPDDDKDDDMVIPTPEPDVTPVVDVIPDVVVTPVVDDTDDDTPAYEPDKQSDIGELDGAVYDVNEILAGGRTVADLRKYDVPAGVVRDAGVTPSAMLDGGYTLAELHEAGYQAADLHGLAGAADLRSAGYGAGDLHGVFSVSECVDAFSPRELRDAGFSVSDFHGLLSAAELRDVFSISELHSVYSVGELRAAGFDAADLNAGGVSWQELAAAGFTAAELESAGAGESTLRQVFPSEFANDDDSSE